VDVWQLCLHAFFLETKRQAIPSSVEVILWLMMEPPYKKYFQPESKKKFQSVLIVYFALVLDNVLLTVVGKHDFDFELL
jgi:hypothetical protein